MLPAHFFRRLPDVGVEEANFQVGQTCNVLARKFAAQQDLGQSQDVLGAFRHRTRAVKEVGEGVCAANVLDTDGRLDGIQSCPTRGGDN